MKLISMCWTVQSLVLVTPLSLHSTESSAKPTALQVAEDSQIQPQSSMTSEVEPHANVAAEEQAVLTCPMMKTTKDCQISVTD